MFGRRILGLLPVLAGCNALLEIDNHDLKADAGSAGASESSAGSGGRGSSSAGKASTGGAVSAQGGSAQNDSGGSSTTGAESGTPGEGGDVASSGGSATSTGGSVANSGGSATSNGGSATSTGGSVTSNACNLACAAGQVCVDGACVACRDSERRCSSDGVPQLCTQHAWVAEPACSSPLGLCSNGACVGIRLIGGLTSVQGALGSTKARLVQGNLELTKPSCSTALGKCVVGGLRP